MKNKTVNTWIIISIIFLIASLILMLTKRKEVDNHIVEINYQEYREIINKDEYNIILLTSTTCDHCLKYKPLVNYVADEYKLTVYDLSLNTISYDEYIELHDKYSILKDSYNKDNNPVILTPTTLVVKNGEEITSVSGNIGYNGFVNLLKENEIIKEK